MINNYSAYSLGDFVNIVSDIGKRNSAVANTPPVLWFRGQRKYDWDLEPIIFRTIARERLKTEENARLEHFMAKNTHYFGREFTCKSEWLEVMQHHAVKTRMLDWSESAMHSLIFTLECFFKSDTHLDADRKSAMPCMWVFEPQKWNRYVIENIIKDAEIQKTVLDLYDNQSDKSEAQKRIDQMIAGGSSDLEVHSAEHLSWIFNLAQIENTAMEFQNNSKLYLMQENELPFLYFMLYTIYILMKKVSVDKVQPLAVTVPYHSERIRSQKGVFAVFPNYKIEGTVAVAKKMGINLLAMQNMDKINHCLHRIKLYNPHKIAYEMMNQGMNVSWLYPEMPVVSNEIEARKITI